MALVGYEMERKKIDEKIKELRARLGGGGSTARVGRPPATETAPRKRQLSAAARKRIAAAQKKRWAEHRKAVAQAAKEESKK
jgi:hypothetical protein